MVISSSEWLQKGEYHEFPSSLTDTNTHGEKRHNKSRKSRAPVAVGVPADQPKKTFMRMCVQESKNSGRSLLERSGLPEPLHQELFKLVCSRYRPAMAIVSTHILKVFADGGPPDRGPGQAWEGAFSKSVFPRAILHVRKRIGMMRPLTADR